MSRLTITAGALALALVVPATAGAVDYPPPKNPGSVPGKPKGPFKTLQVGKGKKHKTIQAAVNAAKAGDTIKIANGTYKEQVKISGQNKRFIKLIGNPAKPDKVVLEGSNTLQNGTCCRITSSVSRTPPPLLTKPRQPRRTHASVFSLPINPASTPLTSSTTKSPGSICATHGYVHTWL